MEAPLAPLRTASHFGQVRPPMPVWVAHIIAINWALSAEPVARQRVSAQLH